MNKTKPERADVIIVGGGLTGTLLAFQLAVANLDVRVFEQKKQKDIPKEKYLLFDQRLSNQIGIKIPSDCIVKRIKEIEINFCGETVSVDCHWDLIDKNVFYNFVYKKAKEAGVVFFFEKEITDPIGKGMWLVGVKQKNEKIEEGKIIVDCSGFERILGKNIEVLDLNYQKQNSKSPYVIIEALFSEKNNKIEIEKENNRPCLMDQTKTTSSIIIHLNDKELVLKHLSKKNKKVTKTTLIEYIQSKSSIREPAVHYTQADVSELKPVTSVWYSFLSIGEAANLSNALVGLDAGRSLQATQIAASKIIESLNKKNLSLEFYWQYYTETMELFGNDFAVLNFLRKEIPKSSGLDIKYLVRNTIITKDDIQQVLNGKYPKLTILRQIKIVAQNITKKRREKILPLIKIWKKANRLHEHYCKLPKKYDTKKYHKWLIKQLGLFRKKIHKLDVPNTANHLKLE